MTTKKVYPSEEIVEKTTVAGNIRDLRQCYSIKYYPKSDDLVEKLALCIHLIKPDTPEENQPMPRYLFISSAEQLKRLIFDLTKAYFYFRDKKVTPLSSREEFRLTNLTDFLIRLKENQINIWKEETYKPSQPL